MQRAGARCMYSVSKTRGRGRTTWAALQVPTSINVGTKERRGGWFSFEE